MRLELDVFVYSSNNPIDLVKANEEYLLYHFALEKEFELM